MSFLDEIVKLQRVRRAFLRFAAETNPGITWAGTSDRRYGKTGDSRGLVPVRGTVQSFGTFTRSIANYETALEIPSITTVLLDVANEWRALADTPSYKLLYRWLEYYLRVQDDNEDLWDSLITVGQIIKPSLTSGGKVSLSVRSAIGDFMGDMVPRRLIGLTDWPRAIPESVGKPVPMVVGRLVNTLPASTGLLPSGVLWSEDFSEGGPLTPKVPHWWIGTSDHRPISDGHVLNTSWDYIFSHHGADSYLHSDATVYGANSFGFSVIEEDNQVLVAALGFYGGSATQVVSATWAGQAMTCAVREETTGLGVSIWYLTSPAAGIGPLVITLDDGALIINYGVSLIGGVDITGDPIRSTASSGSVAQTSPSTLSLPWTYYYKDEGLGDLILTAFIANSGSIPGLADGAAQTPQYVTLPGVDGGSFWDNTFHANTFCPFYGSPNVYPNMVSANPMPISMVWTSTTPAVRHAAICLKARALGDSIYEGADHNLRLSESMDVLIGEGANGSNAIGNRDFTADLDWWDDPTDFDGGVEAACFAMNADNSPTPEGIRCGYLEYDAKFIAATFDAADPDYLPDSWVSIACGSVSNWEIYFDIEHNRNIEDDPETGAHTLVLYYQVAEDDSAWPSTDSPADRIKEFTTAELVTGAFKRVRLQWTAGTVTLDGDGYPHIAADGQLELLFDDVVVAGVYNIRLIFNYDDVEDFNRWGFVNFGFYGFDAIISNLECGTCDQTTPIPVTPTCDDTLTPDQGAAARGGWLQATLVDTGVDIQAPPTNFPAPSSATAAILPQTDAAPTGLTGELQEGGGGIIGRTVYYAIVAIVDGAMSELSAVVGPFTTDAAHRQVALSWDEYTGANSIRVYSGRQSDFAQYDRYRYLAQYGTELPGNATSMVDLWVGYDIQEPPPGGEDPHWDLNYRMTVYYEVSALYTYNGNPVESTGTLCPEVWGAPRLGSPGGDMLTFRVAWTAPPAATDPLLLLAGYRVRRYIRSYTWDWVPSREWSFETTELTFDDPYNDITGVTASTNTLPATLADGPIYLLAGHNLKLVREVYSQQPAPAGGSEQLLLTEGVDYRQQVFEINGNRYHCLVLLVDPKTYNGCEYSVITANVDGAETVGDGSGQLITDGPQIVKWFFLNVLANTYRTGDYFTDVPYAPGFIDTASFSAASAVALARVSTGYIGAGALVTAITGRELIQQLLTTFDLDLYFHQGQWHVSMFNPGAIDRATLSSFDPTDTIFRDTFNVEMDDVRQANLIPFFAGPIGPLGVADGYLISGETLDAVSIAMFGARVSDPIYLLWTQDAATARNVIAHYQEEVKYPPINASFLTPLTSLANYITEAVKVTHPDGLAAGGWVDRVCMITRSDLDLDRLVTGIAVRDIDQVVPVPPELPIPPPPTSPCPVTDLDLIWSDDFSDGDPLSVDYETIWAAETNATCGVGGGWGVRGYGVGDRKWGLFNYVVNAVQYPLGVNGPTFAVELTTDSSFVADDEWGVNIIGVGHYSYSDFIALYLNPDGSLQVGYYDPTLGDPSTGDTGAVAYTATPGTFQTFRLVAHFSTWTGSVCNPDGWIDVCVDGVSVIHATGLCFGSQSTYTPTPGGAPSWARVYFDPAGNADNVSVWGTTV